MFAVLIVAVNLLAIRWVESARSSMTPNGVFGGSKTAYWGPYEMYDGSSVTIVKTPPSKLRVRGEVEAKVPVRQSPATTPFSRSLQRVLVAATASPDPPLRNTILALALTISRRGR